jgi:ribonuclease T2
MKKEIFNILFLAIIVLAVAWLYWPAQPEPGKQVSSDDQNYILALSWQPAFCESKPNKPECRSQRAGRYDTQNFSLHGLWPQPRGNVYCDVSSNIIDRDKRGRWNQLPKLDLSKSFRKDLSKMMPGYRSNLHRHEWFKHGTCMDAKINPQQYFELSIAVLDSVNNSPIKELFADNIGKEVTSNQIVKAMDKSFGKGAGSRIGVSCKRDGRRTLINEIKISIKLEPLSIDKPVFSELIQSSPTLAVGCKRGVIDPVGLQ